MQRTQTRTYMNMYTHAQHTKTMRYSNAWAMYLALLLNNANLSY